MPKTTKAAALAKAEKEKSTAKAPAKKPVVVKKNAARKKAASVVPEFIPGRFYKIGDTAVGEAISVDGSHGQLQRWVKGKPADVGEVLLDENLDIVEINREHCYDLSNAYAWE